MEKIHAFVQTGFACFHSVANLHASQQTAVASARMYGPGHKSKLQTLVHIFLKYWPIFEILSPGTLCEKFTMRWLINTPPHLNCIATQHCEIQLYEKLSTTKSKINKLEKDTRDQNCSDSTLYWLYFTVTVQTGKCQVYHIYVEYTDQLCNFFHWHTLQKFA